MMAYIIELLLKQSAEGSGEIKEAGEQFTSINDVVQDLAKNFALTAVKWGAMVKGFQEIEQFIGDSIQKFAEFDDVIRRAGINSNASAAELQKLAAAAQQIGPELGVSALDAAKGLEALTKEGKSAAESIALLPGAIKLAKVAGDDLGASAGFLTDVMDDYNIAVEDMATVTDTLVKTQENSDAKIKDLAASYDAARNVVKVTGGDFKDLMTIFGSFADAGYQAAEAGSATAKMIAALVTPGKEAGKALKDLNMDTETLGVDMSKSQQALAKLGVEVKDASGNLRPITSIMGDLQTSLEGIPSPADRASVVFDIFGRKVGKDAVALLNVGKDSISKLRGELENAEGSTQKAVDALDGGLGGALRNLSAVSEKLYVQFGQELGPATTALITDAAKFLDQLNSFVAIPLGGLVGDILTIATGLEKGADQAGLLLDALKAVSGFVAIIREGVVTIAYVLETGMQAATLVIMGTFENISNAIGKLISLVDKDLGGKFISLAESLNKGGAELLSTMQKGQDDYLKKITDIDTATKKLFDNLSDQTAKGKTAYDTLSGSVAGFQQQIAAGQITTEEYAAAHEELKAKIEAAYSAGQVTLEQKNKLLATFAYATEHAGETVDALTEAEKGLASQIDKTNKIMSAQGAAAVKEFDKLAAGMKKDISVVSDETGSIISNLQKLTDQSIYSGDAIVQAFARGIDSAKTVADIEAMVQSLKSLQESGQISSSALADGLDLASSKIAEMAARTIATEPDFAKLAGMFDALRGSSVDFADKLETNLVPQIEKLSTQDLSSLKTQIDTLYSQGIVDGQTFMAVNDAITVALSEKFGIAAQDLQTGITTAVTEGITQLTMLQDQGNATSDMLTAAFADLVSRAKTTEDIEILKQALNDLSTSGQISFEQMVVSSDLVEAAFLKISQSSAEGQIAFQALQVAADNFRAALDTQGVSYDDLQVAASEFEAAVKTAFESGTISADQMETALTEIDTAMQQAAATASEMMEATESSSVSFENFGVMSLSWSKELRQKMEELGIVWSAFNGYIEETVQKNTLGQIFKSSVDFMNFNMIQALDRLKIGMEEFNAIVTDTGGATKFSLERAEDLLDTFSLLDQQTLDQLRGQVDELRYSLEDTQNQLLDMIGDISQELARMEGNLAEAEQLRFEEVMKNLREQFEDVADPIAKAYYEELMRLEQEKHEKIIADILAEEAEKKAATERTRDVEEDIMKDVKTPDTTVNQENVRIIEQRIITDQREFNFNLTPDWAEIFRREILPLIQEYDANRA